MKSLRINDETILNPDDVEWWKVVDPNDGRFHLVIVKVKHGEEHTCEPQYAFGGLMLLMNEKRELQIEN